MVICCVRNLNKLEIQIESVQYIMYTKWNDQEKDPEAQRMILKKKNIY